MLVTLALNPCIDRSIQLERLEAGRQNRVLSARADAAGKGVNVAVAAAQLGMRAACVAPLFAENGEALPRLLEEKGIDAHLVKAPGRLRENIKLIEAEGNIYTELNEPGAALPQAVLEQLMQTARTLAAPGATLALCGSLPPGAPADCYRKLLESLPAGVQTVLDASGDALREGWKAAPWLAKPNLEEFSQLTGRSYCDTEAVLQDARRLAAEGPTLLCVSLGDAGALLATRGEGWFCTPCPVEVKGAQGAGDSMVAGLCLAQARRLPPGEMLAYGVAAALASITREGTLLCEDAGFSSMRKRVRPERVY